MSGQAKVKVVGVRVDPEMDRLLHLLARQRGESQSVVLRDLIREAGQKAIAKIEVRPSRAA